MVSGRDLKLPQTLTCDVCGELLEGDPYWITDYPRAVHERCRDWSQVEFPYETSITALPKLGRELRRRWAVVMEAWLLLEAVRIGWPRSAYALPRCREALRKVQELRPVRVEGR